MAWSDDPYVRSLLDTRERWGVFLSLTGVAATLVFLAGHSHHAWINVGPLLVGALGSLYVLVVNCYYKQAEAIASETTDDERAEVKAKRAIWFASRIRILGWFHILAPAIAGGLASLTLWFGLK